MRTFYYLKSTKKPGFMAQNKTSRGYTWATPQETGTPRLFETPRGAQAAIREWARGPQWIDHGPTGDRYGYRVDTNHNRTVNDWTIKEVTL